ncbi:MAG: DNA mismatch repair endonuclease MutL [Bacteroidales bacterium]|nr:DNA mismatch repair endonuclease MutL [Bacteroidales bacterium]MCF8351418.1 DNA mismatch repair endonuclease MutL [Bacteroidales bacterium]MCF8377219.1 DNA mismatch repair endonuclease MutL [Bacteroidales bacterium]MCF8401090.1 DNA mismatch repair endonuclease MutL [Bacteroidales bacterium]
MSDLIKLLPDAVANQIAAGEVIQRPASAVKELLENAIDAGATDIKLVIKDAGKTLIQVTDNGSGMSQTDARMSFERHATSKINQAEDLFAIRTMGFRGEALASIAAIAHVELKSRLHDQELGTYLVIEGSRVISQKPGACPAGTTISVKNLFYNVPARRKFLKSNAAELRHIIEEFNRVAFVHEDIAFTLIHNNNIVYQHPASTLKQRIVSIMGSGYGEKIIPMKQGTDRVEISGFIGKPQYAKKTRGEQYFFANKRYIRHPYLHHAVENAFEELIQDNSFPSYFLYISVEPANIDINIHPTKTEVNFQDNQLIYAILKSAISKSLAQHNITPSLDFEQEQSFDLEELEKGKPIRNPFTPKDVQYNPFETSERKTDLRPGGGQASQQRDWEKLYDPLLERDSRPTEQELPRHDDVHDKSTKIFDIEASRKFFQVQNKYIVSYIKSGMIIIDQHNAHFRILYERFLDHLNKKASVSQKELFPQQLSFSPDNAELLKEIRPNLQLLGFNIKDLGKNTFVVDGRPADCPQDDLYALLERILENFKRNTEKLNIDKNISLARSLAASLSIRHGKRLQPEEMEVLSEQLFSCKVPEKTPGGKLCFWIISFDELQKKFRSTDAT